MERLRFPGALIAFVLFSCAAACATSEPVKPAGPPAPAKEAGPPVAEKVKVTDRFFGVEVAEDYRWLENWDDPKVKAWSAEQDRHARLALEKLPDAASLKARVTEILSADTQSFLSVEFRANKLFAEKRQPPKQQAFLVVLDSWESLEAERVLLDPNQLDPSGQTSIDWYIPSFDGSLVAVSLSKGGTESGDVSVVETASGKVVHEIVPRVNGGTAGGDLAWSPDGKGFFYTRYPRGQERPAEDQNFFQQLYYHALGKPTEDDRYELGKDFPRIAEIQLEMEPRSGRLLATVQNGDGGEFAIYLRTQKGEWQQLARFEDKLVSATFGTKDDLWMISRAGAPRGKIVRVALKNTKKQELLIPEGEASIVSDFWGPPTLRITPSRVFVLVQLGGPSEIRAFDHAGKPKPGPNVPAVSAVGSMVGLTGDDFLFSQTSFLDPPAWFHYGEKGQKTTRTALASRSPVDFSGYEVTRENASSKDGTLVPLNIIAKKASAAKTKSPCVISGYGGYGVNMSPRFTPGHAVLLEHGASFVVTNLRGGGEFGEAWHRQGSLLNKQNVFDDFAAAIQHLVNKGHCNQDQVAIMGGSNGGLLMGALLTQHPSLVKVVVSFVGIYDMLRVELSPNGAFNITEFGTVKDEAQFKALFAYSPYHRVSDGTTYPASLFLTGANDPRVDPMQSRKMVARLQAASPTGSKILLRTSGNSGHGGDTALDERISQWSDVYAFLLSELGLRINPR